MMSINVLEKYILESNGKIDLDNVTPYSEEYYYLELIQLMKDQEDLSKVDEQLEKFVTNNRFSNEKKKFLQLKYLLTRIDRAQDENERQKLVNKFNDEFTRFKFYHQRTTKGSHNTSALGQEKKLPSEISKEQEQKFTFQYYLDKLYQSKFINDLENLNPQYTCMIDLSKLINDNMNFTHRLIQLIDCWTQVKGVDEFLNYHLKKERNNIPSNYLQKIFNELDVEKVEKYFKNYYNLRNDTELFYHVLYKRKFQDIKYNESLEQVEEQTQQRIKFLEQYKNYQNTISILKKNLLIVQSKQDIYNEDLLLDYLENPDSNDYLRSDYIKNNLNKKKEGQVRSIPIDNLGKLDIYKYIQQSQINKKDINLSKYSKYIDNKKLQQIEIESKLFCGQQVKNVEEIINETQLKQLNESRELSFWNCKTKFIQDEEVNIQLLIKNIKNLRVRIFEVNTQNFYLHSGQNADPNDIKIDCVIPNQEMEYQYEQQSMIKHVEKLNLDYLTQKKRGLFIVDLVGEEKNSKAIIKKGYLTLLYDKLTGRNCVIIDEQNNICKSKNTGIYIGNKFIQANEESGIIKLHKDIGEQNTNIILVHDGFACPGQIKIQEINYTLNYIPIFNAEEFQAGKQINIINMIDLYANDIKCSLKLLKDNMITIISQNDAGVEQQKVYKDIQLQDNEDLVLNYMIPPKLTQLRIQFKSKIKKNNKDEELYVEQQFEFMRTQQQGTIDSILRKNKNDEYILEIFSFNGEPIKNKKLQFQFYLIQIKHSQTIELQSNEQGQFMLGKLEGVKYFRCDQLQNNFDIQNDYIQYIPDKITISENEEVKIPINKNQTLYSFQILSTQENKKVTQPQLKDGYLMINNLPKGQYQILLLPNLQKIEIDVLEGEIFNLNGKNIIQKDKIIGVQQNQLGLDANIESQDDKMIKVNLKGNTNQTKIHVLLTNQSFNSLQCNLNQNTLRDRIKRNQNIEYNINEPKNSYYSDGRLSDELVYVYNRKQRQNMMGNTLEKPGSILKREKVQDTKENEENLKDRKQALLRECLERDLCRSKAEGCGYGYNSARGRNACMDNQIMLRDFFNNKNSMIIPNLQLDDNNNVQIDQNLLSNYSNVYLYGHNNEGQFLLEIQNDHKKINTNDIRLQESKEQNKIYRYDRSFDYLKIDNTYQIKRVDKQEVSFVEDIKSLYESICLLNPELDNKEVCKLISKWDTLQKEDKLKKYDKNACLELNLFLYMKDKEFFEGVIKPFIQNKKEKTITDYFMLNDIYNLKNFAKVEKIEELNNIERILLMISLLEEDQQYVQSILNYYSMHAQLDQIDMKLQKRLFDSILQTKKSEVKQAEQFMMQNNVMNQIVQDRQMIPPQMAQQRTMLLGAMNAPRMMMNRGGAMRKMKKQSENRYGNLDYANFEELKEDQNFQIFKPLEGTVEYQEKNYEFKYNNTKAQKFWYDLALHISQHKSFDNFFSENFIHVCYQGHLTECLAVLSFFDLKFQKQQLQSTLDDNTLTLIPQTPLIALTKEIIEENGKQGDLQIMIGQRFYDPEDKYTYDETDPSLKYEKAVKEIIKGKIYESTVVVTNSSSTPLKVNLVYQIPQGSIRVYSLNQMEIKDITLESLQSQSQSFQFYFPESGKFDIYPACVIKDDQILAVSQIEQQIEVKEKQTIVELNTMQDILESGSLQDILQFIENKNILNRNIFKFEDIYWLLNNKDVYEKIINVLNKKGIYDEIIWSYSIKHNDIQRFKELLNSKRIRQILNNNIQYLDTDLIKIDNFKLLEYYPLVNPRTFSLQQENQTNILNENFKKTYEKFLIYLFQKDQLTNNDKIILCNYLICQDRIIEANKLIENIDIQKLEENEMILQYDYLIAYLDFMNGYPNFEKAKQICEKYLLYPVLTWRNLFVEIANQLAEFEETELIEKMIDEDEQKSNQQKSKNAPSLDCKIEKNKIEIVYQNINNIEIKMFKIDLEAYISLNPLSEISIEKYTYTTPFSYENMNLNINEKRIEYEIPQELKKENLFIQILNQQIGISNSCYLQYIPFELSYHLNKEFGILKLIQQSTMQAVPKVYIKCFAQYQNDQTKFYKDGFTDLRGSFDYVSLNKDKVDDIKQFIIFVNSEQHGCKIIKTTPPVKIGRIEGEAKNLISQNWVQRQKIAPRMQQNKYTDVMF